MSDILDWGAALAVSIAGVDRTADLTGAGEVDRETDAAGLATFRLARGTVKPSVGDAVAIGGIVATTYVGEVSAVAYDPSARCWVVSCSDGLQAHFEALGSGVAVCQQLPAGAIWHQDLHGEFRDGWAACQDALATIPYSIFLEGGALHAASWAGTGYTSTIEHAAGGIYDGSVGLREASARELVREVTATVQIIYSRLHHWSLTVGWQVQVPPSDPESSAPAWTDPGWNFRRYLIRPFSLPTRQQIAEAMSGNSWTLMHSRAGLISAGGDGLGIRTEGLPGSGIYLADQYLPMDTAVTLLGVVPDLIWVSTGTANASEAACINASGTLGRRWAQTIEEIYTLTVRAPAGTPGAALADESAHHQAPCDDAAWDASPAAILPAGTQWQGGLVHNWADILVSANRELVLRGMLQTMATRIRRSHRQTVLTATVEPGAEPDLGSRVRIIAEDLDATGQVVRLRTTWDIASHQAGCEVTLTPTAGTTAADALDPPAVPDVSPAAAGYTLDGSLVLGNHIGGLFDSAEQDDAWDGWVGNVIATDPTNSWGLVDLTYPRPDAPTYTEGFVVRTPDVPPTARDDQSGTCTAIYEVASLAGAVTIL